MNCRCLLSSLRGRLRAKMCKHAKESYSERPVDPARRRRKRKKRLSVPPLLKVSDHLIFDENAHVTLELIPFQVPLPNAEDVSEDVIWPVDVIHRRNELRFR